MFRKAAGGGRAPGKRNNAPADASEGTEEDPAKGQRTRDSGVARGDLDFDRNGDRNGDGDPSSEHDADPPGQYTGRYDPGEALIYAAPTVDTLGDEESLSRMYHSPRQASDTPGGGYRAFSKTTKSNSDNASGGNSSTHHYGNSGSGNTNTKPLMREDSLLLPSLSSSLSASLSIAERSMGQTPTRGVPNHGSRASSNEGSSRSSRSLRSNRSKIRRQRSLIEQQQQQEDQRRRLQQQQLQRLNRERRRRQASKSSREFQLEEDRASVVVRSVPVAERTAFDKKLPPYLVPGQGSASSSAASNVAGSGEAVSGRKVSPSPQHWRVLQQLSNVTHVRQLAFSSGLGAAADVFWSEESEDLEDNSPYEPHQANTVGAETTDGAAVHKPGTSSGKVPRDGRYRSIDPVKATMDALPKTPPLLSNKKHRLPMRADVGFPHAGADEIARKQNEIRMETEWEEASPRLVVLVTGDDLGTADHDDDAEESKASCDRSRDSETTATGRLHKTRGLPGMPWAGKDLVRAKERNHRHFSRRQEGMRSSPPPSSRNDDARNATNMLAPPLDAIHSRTMGWRPRPFHDRPPGLRYALVCPMTVRFSVGKMEPLVCSMALYSLKTGKISEEFYFPAGDWDDKLRLDAIEKRRQGGERRECADEADLLNELWSQRKHKAIFAYNTWAVDAREPEKDDALHVVLQVYKVSHTDALTAYLTSSSTEYRSSFSSSSDKKSWRKKLRKRFEKDQRRPNGGSSVAGDDAEIEKAILRSSSVFEAYGTQFTSPLCYGITRLFPEDTDATSRINTWPRGQVQQNMDLYASPSYSESQDDFLKRLRKAAASAPTFHGSDALGHSRSTSSSNLSTVSEELTRSTSGGDEDPPAEPQAPGASSATKKKGGMRRFVASKRSSKKGPGSDSGAKHIEDTPSIPGSVTLFTSHLGVDFLQSMLATPPELIDKISIQKAAPNDSGEPEEVVLPRILVDASGDSAIMVDPKKTATNSSKRSDLVRLPSTRLAEHLDSSEFREVLYFSPEPDRIFEPSDHRSLLNLLYLYPRLLVLKSSDGGGTVAKDGHRHKYTVRMRLVQNVSSTSESGVIESRNEIITSFHNPASWSGSNLLQSVFTRIPRDGAESGPKRRQKADDPRAGISLRDEFKMKLPVILDGTYFLQFSLFAVEIHDYIDGRSLLGSRDSFSSGSSGEADCGITLSPLAETTIPLSSSSTRDPRSGVKATTVIPNGCHRLKLGNFQLQVETRLVSSIHVSDPAVGAALREFPLASNDGHPGNIRGNEVLEEMAISSRHSAVGRSVSSRGSEGFPAKISFATLMAAASGNGLASHFHSLFYLHLRNLTKTTGQEMETSEKFIVDNMQSMLVLFQKVKSFFLSQGRDRDRVRLAMFFKANLDLFDEASYNVTSNAQHIEDDSASEYIVEQRHSLEMDVTEEEQDEVFDGGAIRRRTRDPVSSDLVIRLTRTYSTLEATEVSFSRVAYGASKSDHMRLEAQLGNERGRVTKLFDDDETVVTLMSPKHIDSFIEGGKSFDKMTKGLSISQHDENLNESQVHSVNVLEKTAGNPEKLIDIEMPGSQTPMSEFNIGMRMKSAAQVVLAPCATVTPTLAAFLCRTSPRNFSSAFGGIETTPDFESVPKALQAGLEPITEEDDPAPISCPGSDLDDEDADEIAPEKRDGSSSPYCTNDGIFRGARNIVKLEFSIRQGCSDRRKAQVSRGQYVYETIMVLWLQAWSNYVSNLPQNSENGVAINFLGQGVIGNTFSMFYLQIDFILPMLLKSVILRCSQLLKAPGKRGARCILDEDHVYVFESFFEMLAIGLMGQAMTELQEPTEHGTLCDAINTCDHILDFIIGLLAVFHPAHMEGIISRFIMTLRKCENDNNAYRKKTSIEWNEATVHRTRCSCQLRLRIVEKLAVVPNFVALNYPQRFLSKHLSSRREKSSWTMQHEIGLSNNGNKQERESNAMDDGLLPRAGWLASILTNESLSICAHSCETVITDVMATIETHESKNDKTPLRSSKKKQAVPSLKRSNLLMFQSMAIHAISCVYELLIRRHAMDRRFQKESSRERIAALFTGPIFERSLASVRWLARVDSTHKVRSIWLLCFVYILQEAPENLVREHIRKYSNPSDFKIHQFIRLLRLGSATFQSFVDQERHCMFPSEIDKEISPWLLQESFNTVCATTIIVVEECADLTSSIPNEQKKMFRDILDLLLHVLTTPQSTVTHLRAVGGAIQAFEKFGAQMFLETTGGHFQHWIRVIVGLMNSVALSVRSIAVDFVVSILCGVFDLNGNIEDVTLIFATVLPEVVAREIALCSVNGLVKKLEDAEKSIWPLRRSFADIEDANPLDDDRVDPQLLPVLTLFCRASQAIIDGVLVEMRLRGTGCVVVGTKILPENRQKYTFDADEESLFEAANYFTPETSPMQRLRWLLTLKSLHESKGQWVEAAETLIMSARTISDAIPHLNYIWRPNRFSLWSDSRRSLWLSTVGVEIGNPERGNAQVMTFANSFLEPEGLLTTDEVSQNLELSRPTLQHICSLLISVSKEAVDMYSQEGGTDALAYTRLESLLRIVMSVLDGQETRALQTRGLGLNAILQRKQYVEDVTCLRKVIASITGDMTKIAEKLLVVAKDETKSSKSTTSQNETQEILIEDNRYYVRLLLSGKKPRRFEESTSLPTFLEWESPCICRVPKGVIEEALKSKSRNSKLSDRAICEAFCKSIRNGLLQDLDATELVFVTGTPTTRDASPDVTYINIDIVRTDSLSSETGLQNGSGPNLRRFIYSKPCDTQQGVESKYVQMTVALPFPCPLSRQRSMLTNQLVSSD